MTRFLAPLPGATASWLFERRPSLVDPRRTNASPPHRLRKSIFGAIVVSHAATLRSAVGERPPPSAALLRFDRKWSLRSGLASGGRLNHLSRFAHPTI